MATNGFLSKSYHQPVARIDPDMTPDYCIGEYNGQAIGLVLHGSALDPPTVDIEVFDSLEVQYAHRNMFVGLRIKESTMSDMTVFTLGKSASTTKSKKVAKLTAQGNVCSSTIMTRCNRTLTGDGSDSSALDEDCHWFNTGYVLVLDTASSDIFKFYLVYKYKVYDTEYLHTGGEKRVEEPEQEEPPKFCNGADGFTVALLGDPNRPHQHPLMTRPDHFFSQKVWKHTSLSTDVLSTKKPGLAPAGYKNDRHSYIPVFPDPVLPSSPVSLDPP